MVFKFELHNHQGIPEEAQLNIHRGMDLVYAQCLGKLITSIYL